MLYSSHALLPVGMRWAQFEANKRRVPSSTSQLFLQILVHLQAVSDKAEGTESSCSIQAGAEERAVWHSELQGNAL